MDIHKKCFDIPPVSNRLGVKFMSLITMIIQTNHNYEVNNETGKYIQNHKISN